MTTVLTYDGPFTRAAVMLPERRVDVVRGQKYSFAADEIEHLDAAAWVELRPAAALAGPPTAADVVKGSVADVLEAAAGDPALAAELLAAEQAGRNRKTAVEPLQALVDQAATEAAATPADQATDPAQEG